MPMTVRDFIKVNEFKILAYEIFDKRICNIIIGKRKYSDVLL